MDTISHTTTALPALADRAQRYDGWTPDRQRAFLEAIAEGHTVGSACALVGMAQSSAYALRRRAAGAGFALGWRAANLLARDKVADTLLARAIDGQVETLTRPDGETITRHRYDNRLASTMLARLDRFADKDSGEATHQAARLVAAEFDGFLDLIDQDQGPARAGVFLAARIAGDAGRSRSRRRPVARPRRSLAAHRPRRRVGNRRGRSRSTRPRPLDPPNNGPVQRPPAWSPSPPRTIPRETLHFLHFTRTTTMRRRGRTCPYGTTNAPANGARTFLRPMISTAIRRAITATRNIRGTLSWPEEEAVTARRRVEVAALSIIGAAARDAWFAGLGATARGDAASALCADAERFPGASPARPPCGNVTAPESFSTA